MSKAGKSMGSMEKRMGMAAGTPTLGLRVQGSGFRVQGSGFRVQGLGFRIVALYRGASSPGTFFFFFFITLGLELSDSTIL